MPIVKLKLMVQGGDVTMVAEGETPVLCDSDIKDEVLIQQAVNFLRCKCPGVQVLLHVPTGGMYEAEKRVAALGRILSLLSGTYHPPEGKENLRISSPRRVDGEEQCFVCTFSRDFSSYALPR